MWDIDWNVAPAKSEIPPATIPQCKVLDIIVFCSYEGKHVPPRRLCMFRGFKRKSSYPISRNFYLIKRFLNNKKCRSSNQLKRARPQRARSKESNGDSKYLLFSQLSAQAKSNNQDGIMQIMTACTLATS